MTRAMNQNRKTPKAVLAMLDDHDAQVSFWATAKEDVDGTPLSDERRVGIVMGLNAMMESALMKHGCYQGFRYVKHVRAENRDSPSAVNGWLLEWNTGKAHTVLEMNTRSYFRKF